MALPGTPGAMPNPPTVPSNPPWNVCTYGGFMPRVSATLPGRISLKIPKPARSTVWDVKLPRDCRSRLEDGQGRGSEQVAEVRLNRRVQRLIDIMGNRTE